MKSTIARCYQDENLTHKDLTPLYLMSWGLSTDEVILKIELSLILVFIRLNVILYNQHVFYFLSFFVSSSQTKKFLTITFSYSTRKNICEIKRFILMHDKKLITSKSDGKNVMLVNVVMPSKLHFFKLLLNLQILCKV